MKKITSIICLIFALIMVLALPVGAATPYQTYTYSIEGEALYSPDAYTPSKSVDATYMGLTDAAILSQFHSDLAVLYEALLKAEKALVEPTAEMEKAEKAEAAAQAAYDAAVKYAAENKNDPDAGYKVQDAKEKLDTVKAVTKTAESALKKAKTTYDTAESKFDTLYSSLSTIARPSDIEVDENQNVYIADTGNNRIVILDRYYKVKEIISTFTNKEGIADSLEGPQGVFITPDKIVAGEKVAGKIYVCDTEKSRIVTFDHDGNFLDIIPQPESELFDEGSVYKPVAVAVDNYDRLYVVSSSTIQGIIVMTDEGEFTGFVGAQKVVIGAWDRIWRRFQTEEQRELSQAYVSTEFNNITLSGDFIYVTTSTIDEKDVLNSLKTTSGDFAPVKMLNAAGDEIMRRNGFFAPSGEIDHQKSKVSDKIFGASIIVDVAVGPEKTWSIIDNKRSKVFTYDFDGNLLFAFGDMGRQLGNITQDALAGIVYQGDSMLLLNKSQSTFTVYRRTEYGDVLIQALENQNKRQNDQAINDWTEILKRNSNFDAAYIGIGNALYRSGKYEESLEYYQAAYDTTNYSNSYKELRKEWLSKYILLIPVFVVAVCFIWIKFMGYAKKVNKRVSTTVGKRTYGQELLYTFHLIFHPFDGFWDLKHEKRGSVRAGATILAAAVLVFYYQAIGQGYVQNPQGMYSSLFTVLLSVCVPAFLWMAGNWCLTTLFDGEGSFKDIFIATTYSLAPIVLIWIPVTIASNFVLVDELNILSVITAIGFVWVGLLLFFGTMVTHDYTMGKNFALTLFTIVGMICIMFIAILFSTLLGKLVSFVTNIITELQFRM